MTTTFDNFLLNVNHALNILVVPSEPWDAIQLTAFCNEAFQMFPILRPMQKENTILLRTYSVPMEPNFRDVISVEHPPLQMPPAFITRVSRFTDEFYQGEHYDIDYDYSSGVGYLLWTSFELNVDEVIRINYLAIHKCDYAEDSTADLTVPDQYLPICIAYVVWKSFQNRLANYTQDPTAYSQLIQQMSQATSQAYTHYMNMLNTLYSQRSHSAIITQRTMDRFDRVY